MLFRNNEEKEKKSPLARRAWGPIIPSARRVIGGIGRTTAEGLNMSLYLY